jgi:glycosyltransferase involved in cell wall biosynthesis
MSEQLENIKNSIEKIKSKDFGIYFFTIDTKGNPVAGVATIYEHVKTLRDLGYNAQILHDKNDYKIREDENGMGIAEWLGEEYASLPHVSIESQKLQVGPSDFVVIPEAFASIIKQTVNFPCKRIVFLQSYEYIFEMLEIGEGWEQYGIKDVITTNESLSEYVKSIFRGVSTQIIPVGIADYFTNSEKPKIPTIAMSARDKRELLKIVKIFYQKYPHYRFVTFRDMSGLPRQEFAKELGTSFLSVWVDELSSFGTFPIESMKCGTPVIGKIPRMVPEWMGTIDKNGTLNLNDNGIWTANLNSIPDIIATMVGLYLEDALPENITEGMKEYETKYTTEEFVKTLTDVYERTFTNRIVELETTYTQLSEKELTEETK